MSLRICGVTSASVFCCSGFDLQDRDQDRAEPALDRRAHLAVLEREGGVGDGRIDDFRFRYSAEIDVRLLQPAFGGERGETQAVLDARIGGLGFRHGRKHDLLDVPALRRDIAAAMVVEGFFDVRLGDFHPFGEFRRRHLDGGDLAVFRRPEQDLARLEILAQLIGGRLRNIARLRRAEDHVVDVALLVLKLVDGFEPCLRHRQVAGERIDDLPAQHRPPLFGDEPLFAIAGVAQELGEPQAVELPGRGAQRRIGSEPLHDVGIGNSEPHLLRPLVEPGLGDHVAQHLPVETEGARLFRCQRMADLARKLL